MVWEECPGRTARFSLLQDPSPPSSREVFLVPVIPRDLFSQFQENDRGRFPRPPSPGPLATPPKYQEKPTLSSNSNNLATSPDARPFQQNGYPLAAAGAGRGDAIALPSFLKFQGKGEGQSRSAHPQWMPQGNRPSIYIQL